jgi:L-aspartate oxidase
MVYDVVIIGSGIAGLYAAANIPTDKKVLVICKDDPQMCNTWYAQGGITTVRDAEDIALYVKDTYEAGARMGKIKVIHGVAKESQAVVADLISRGMKFDTDTQGNLLYTKEAAHSTNRILHAGGDATGARLHEFLTSINPHPILSRKNVVDLLVEDGHCYGVTVMECCGEEKGYVLENIYAKCVMIASGGVGGLYAFHTNARTISGEIHGICIDKGITLDSMEMMQFHPTVFVNNDYARKVLLTEALRGEGATIVNDQGERIVFRYDPRGELAPRDIVSRAIFDYQQKEGQVYLSCQNFSHDEFCERFPTVYASMKEAGYELPKDLIPISPAFHYAMGGIVCDEEGKIPHYDNLYVIGEAASTGLHGGNRLASNSLLEGLVFAQRATRDWLGSDVLFHEKTFDCTNEIMGMKEDKIIKNALRELMWKSVGIVRTKGGLQEALGIINHWLDCEIGRIIRLRLLTAKAIVEAALRRKLSTGAHYIKAGE